jgi:16S rRNA processing protein RimM
MADADRVEVGYVARAHGVRGEIKVACYNPASLALLEARAVTISGRGYRVLAARAANELFILRLAEVTDRDVAEGMRGQIVEVERALVAADDEVLLADLVGLRAELEDGSAWGQVVGVDTGPQDRLVIHHEGVERLLPVVDAFVLEVDLPGGRVIVAPPEGLPEHPIEGPSRG